jgi:hypothetical protein
LESRLRARGAFAAASGHEAIIKALDDRIAQYVDEGWSFDLQLRLGGSGQSGQPAGFGD